jgi:hypothetical protein
MEDCVITFDNLNINSSNIPNLKNMYSFQLTHDTKNVEKIKNEIINTTTTPTTTTIHHHHFLNCSVENNDFRNMIALIVFIINKDKLKKKKFLNFYLQTKVPKVVQGFLIKQGFFNL